MKPKQIIIPLVFLLLIVVGSIVGVYLVRQQQTSIEPKAVVEENGTAAMYLSPTNQEVEVGNSFQSDIMFTVEGGAAINLISAEIQYQYTGDDPFSIGNPVINPDLITNSWNFTVKNTTVDDTSKTVTIEINGSTFDQDGYSAPNATKIASVTFTGDKPGSVSLKILHTNSEIRLVSGYDALSVPTNPAATYSVVAAEEPEPTFTPTPTTADEPDPTATPTSAPSDGGSDDSGITKRNIQVTNITDGQTLTDTTPTFSGTATDNSSIDADVTSDSGTSITGYTTADSNGNWTWTASSPLSYQRHVATFISTDEDSDESSDSVYFYVASGSASTTLPTAGTTEATFAILSIGALMILAGMGLIILK